MPQLALQPDGGNGYVWITLDGQHLVPLHEEDDEGLKVVTTALVASGVIDTEEAAAIQVVTVRTVEAHAATYAETGNSVDLIDRRHFNLGQQTDYRMELYKPALIHQSVMNVVQGQENTERGLGGGRIWRHFALYTWLYTVFSVILCQQSELYSLHIGQLVRCPPYMGTE